MEMVDSRLDGRSGTFVLQHGGVFEDGVAKITMSVVRRSGTGDLCDPVAISVGHDKSYAMALE
jgi:uncharacterized protein DUF3224